MLKFIANRPTILFNLGIALNVAVMMPAFFVAMQMIDDALMAAGGPGLFFIAMGPAFGVMVVLFIVQLYYWNRWVEARVWEWRGRVLGPVR